MPTIRRFEEIEAWSEARSLCRAIYAASSAGGFARDLGLRDGLRRAAVAVLAAIAEGFEHDGNREFLQFLGRARGSAGEVRALLYVALDQACLSEGDFSRLHRGADAVIRKLVRLIQQLRQPSLGGNGLLPVSLPALDRLETEPWHPDPGT